jgi:hypothetical protein
MIFFGLSLKTSSYGLVIWTSKSPRWFLGIDLKTKRATICRLCHKTDRRATACNTRRDLATCFMWKQVRLGFPCLASRLAEVRRRLVHVTPLWRLHRNEVEDGRVNAMDCVGLCYPCFVVFFVLGNRGIVVFLVFYFDL